MRPTGKAGRPRASRLDQIEAAAHAAILREDVLPALDLTQMEFADHLGVSRLTVSEVLLEKRSVTPDMAIRLGKLLGDGPEIWLRMQQAVDVWTLEQRGGYERIERLEAA